jgi:hypothetical protein
MCSLVSDGSGKGLLVGSFARQWNSGYVEGKFIGSFRKYQLLATDYCMNVVYTHTYTYAHTQTQTNTHSKANSETLFLQEFVGDVQTNNAIYRNSVQRFQAGSVYGPNE